jgi:hypothetical protein
MSKIAPNINFTHTKWKFLTRFRSKKWIIGTHKSQIKDAFVNAMINIEVQIENNKKDRYHNIKRIYNFIFIISPAHL